MRGSKTLQERKQIVQKASVILCVSKFIKNKFLSGFDYEPKNVHVLYNGQIVKSGGFELVHELEEHGYDDIIQQHHKD